MTLTKQELSNFGMSGFGSLDDQEIIALNFNLKEKMIRQIPRIIKESPDVIAKLGSLGANHKVAYEEINLKLKNGDDINPFLSKQAVKPQYQDYLLLDWNIHHLHLNNKNSGVYFNDRSDFLLFAIFTDDAVYFIDIEHHNDDEVFVKREYLKIIKDSWPEIIEPYKLRDVLDLSFHPTNEEIKKLRKNQLNTILKIDDDVYAPIGGGITTAGTGIKHITKAIKWKKYINSIEAKYLANEKKVLEDIFKKTGRRFSCLDLDFAYDHDHLVLIDKNSSLIIETMGT